MKNDHSLTFTAAIVLAGVVLAFVAPVDANSATLVADGIAAASKNLPSAVATSDAPATKHGKRGHRSKEGCPQISRVDPRA